jgi:hypothetical protein
MASLLAVDLGLKAGLALYGDNGKLCWYRSHNFGTTERLRRGVPGILNAIPDLVAMVIEGGGNLATVWEKEAERREITHYRIDAAMWRQMFLYCREQRTGPESKKHAGEIARKVIEWADAPRPTSLRHDAAEAIMVGLWGVLALGWLDVLPKELQRAHFSMLAKS